MPLQHRNSFEQVGWSANPALLLWYQLVWMGVEWRDLLENNPFSIFHLPPPHIQWCYISCYGAVRKFGGLSPKKKITKTVSYCSIILLQNASMSSADCQNLWWCSGVSSTFLSAVEHGNMVSLNMAHTVPAYVEILMSKHDSILAKVVEYMKKNYPCGWT